MEKLALFWEILATAVVASVTPKDFSVPGDTVSEDTSWVLTSVQVALASVPEDTTLVWAPGRLYCSIHVVLSTVLDLTVLVLAPDLWVELECTVTLLVRAVEQATFQ
jgi:hypothetical protein